jgi:N-acylneuraminate cytidylyltransferase
MRLAILPARGGSIRIPDKNIVDFCGRPLIGWPLMAAKESGMFDTVHVSTDSERYIEIVRSLGFEVEFPRDPELARNRVSILNVLRWVVREFEKRGKRFDEVCLIMATAPLIEAGDLKRGHALFVEHGQKIPVLAVASFPAPPERGFCIGGDGLLKPLSPEKRALHSQDLKPAYYDAGAFFFIRTEQLLADTREVYNEMLPLILPRDKAIDIDEAEDLEMAETLFLGRAAKKGRRTP